MKTTPFAVVVVCLLLVLGPRSVAAFGDCSASGYLADVDDRMRGIATDCVEADRFVIQTPKGERQVRIVHTTELPTLDLPVMLREIRRGVERSASSLSAVGALAPADITVWIAHLMPESGIVDGDDEDEVEGQVVIADDGCLMGIYPGMVGRRGLAFTTAHEFFHCVQAAEFPVAFERSGQAWWLEGTAEWFANLVFQNTGGSDNFVRQFDSRSHTTSLTDMTYDSVVFFFWLGQRHGYESIGRLMRALPQESGSAQQDALAAFLPADQWQEFAEAYLDGELVQPGGRSLVSDPFPGNIYVWGRTGRAHDISAARFVLARAQLEFSCGVWSITEQSGEGTRAYREQDQPWQGELPDRIVSESARLRLFQMAGFGTGARGLAVRIEAVPDACQACPDPDDTEIAMDGCLVGSWELVSGGYGAMIGEQLKQTGFFEQVDYPDLHRYLVLESNGRYRQGPSEEGESGTLSSRSPKGELWKGLATLKLGTEGSWNSEDDVLHMCEELRDVALDLELVRPDGGREQFSHGTPAAETLLIPRQRQYVCTDSRLRLTETAPGMPSVNWEYRRKD